LVKSARWKERRCHPVIFMVGKITGKRVIEIISNIENTKFFGTRCITRYRKFARKKAGLFF